MCCQTVVTQTFSTASALCIGHDGEQESEIEECQWMPRRRFAQQNADSGTVLLRELSTIMEAHLASEAGAEAAAGAEELRAATSAPGVGEGGGGREDRVGVEKSERRRHAAAFTAKMLESSRKYGGKSMLYHGKL